MQMRISRILVAAALTALTVLALSAASANASITPTVTVFDEDSGTECPAITSPTVAEEDHAPGTIGPVTGGCIIDFQGEFLLFSHVLGFEVEISDCVIESLELHVDGEGEGWADNFSLMDHAGVNDCPYAPCVDGLGRTELSPAHFDEIATNELLLAIELCVDDNGTERECEIGLDIDESSEHGYFNQQSDVDGFDHGNAPNCEVNLSLELKTSTQTHNDIEIVHGHDL